MHGIADPASFRDPAGIVFRRDGVLLRQINLSFGDRWDTLESAGILGRLQERGLLVAHEPTSLELALDPERAHAVIRPAELPFLSWPYEWSFGMLRDAALLTLEIQALATGAGFTLRDASAYNVQFQRARPILIDTLSLEPAEPGAPWIAYRQFCEQFLAPLALMARRDIRLGGLLRQHLDGVPLDLAARLLPTRTRFNLGLGAHVHAHAAAQRRHERGGASAGHAARRASVGKVRGEAMIDSLRRTIEGLRWEPGGTEWADYDPGESAGAASLAKDELVRVMLVAAGGSVVWDLGANAGRYSAIAAELGRRVVAWDTDPAATERHYRRLRGPNPDPRGGNDAGEVLPLLGDLANPSPPLGWALEERPSMIDRADADVVLALALVHHLAIGRNVPLARIAGFFRQLGPGLIVEFVGRDDPMVERLLATREDVFDDYNPDGFRAAFEAEYRIVDERRIAGTDRTIFRMIARP